MPLNADTKEVGGMASQNTQSLTQGSSLEGPATPTKESPSKFVNSPNTKVASTPEQ